MLAAAGQFFIVHTIRRFGALVFAAVMTTRQFLSILVSSIVFGNPLSAGQWCAPDPTCPCPVHAALPVCIPSLSTGRILQLFTAVASCCSQFPGRQGVETAWKGVGYLRRPADTMHACRAGTAVVFVALYYRSAAAAKAKQAAEEGPGLQLDREPLLPAPKGSPGPKRAAAPWDVEASARADSDPALRKD